MMSNSFLSFKLVHTNHGFQPQEPLTPLTQPPAPPSPGRTLLTWGSAALICRWSTSLSCSAPCSLVWDWIRVSCVSLRDSSSLSLSSNMLTISCSKLASWSEPFGTPPAPLGGPAESPSLMVGITSHIIFPALSGQRYRTVSLLFQRGNVWFRSLINRHAFTHKMAY